MFKSSPENRAMRREKGTFFDRHKILLILVFLGFVMVPGVFFLSWYGIYLNGLINEEFNRSRWNLPSRIYSDREVLYPGFNVYHRDLKGKLERLDYRQTQEIQLPGEYQLTPSHWDIYLKDFSYPYRKFKSYPLRIKLESSGTIREMINLTTQQIIPRVEVEPELLATLFDEQVENRSWVRLEEVPSHLIDAILAIEDSRFYGHPGIDPIGILRALFVNLRHGEVLQGGSTITQQLIKNVLAKREKTLFRKLNEILLALMLEAKYSKEQILELYLNEVYLGQRGAMSISGVKEGARYYFSKEVPYLSVAESALLAGLLKAPNTYSPFQDPQKAKARREVVLKQMLDQGKISVEVYAQAVLEPLPVKPDESPMKQERKLKQAPYFVDYVVEQLKGKYSYEELKRKGYKIFTTLDVTSQNLAEEALREGLTQLEKKHKFLDIRGRRDPLQGSLIFMESQTGYIRALVGGRDYELSQFNRAVQAKRQPGSLFKPFVYLTALDPLGKTRYRPDSPVSDLPLVVEHGGRRWSPENYDRVSHGITTLQRALERSYNIAAVRLALEVGLENVIQTAQRAGIKSRMEAIPSLPLGVFEVTPLEIASAYLSIANIGVKKESVSILYVVNRDGEAVEKYKTTLEEGVSPQAAYEVHKMLEGVVERGTGSEVRKLGYKGAVAGKTGTTNDYKDAWFVGYTPEYLTLVWVGYDQGQPTMLKGSEAALPIWVRFMNKIDAGKDSKTFRESSSTPLLASIRSDCSSISGCIQEDPYVGSEDNNLASAAEGDLSQPSLFLASSTPNSQNSSTTIHSLLTCGGVQSREPVACGDIFSREQGKVYTWMRVSEMNPPTTLTHIYYHNGIKQGEINLSIQYSNTRTWSYKDITSEGSAGQWTVAVTNESGEVLMTKSFIVE